jgi:hypothetical protein
MTPSAFFTGLQALNLATKLDGRVFCSLFEWKVVEALDNDIVCRRNKPANEGTPGTVLQGTILSACLTRNVYHAFCFEPDILERLFVETVNVVASHKARLDIDPIF